MLMTVLKVADYSVEAGKDKAVTGTSFIGKHTEFQYFSITDYAQLLPKTSAIFHISLSGECQSTQNMYHSLLTFPMWQTHSTVMSHKHDPQHRS